MSRQQNLLLDVIDGPIALDQYTKKSRRSFCLNAEQNTPPRKDEHTLEGWDGRLHRASLCKQILEDKADH